MIIIKLGFHHLSKVYFYMKLKNRCVKSVFCYWRHQGNSQRSFVGIILSAKIPNGANYFVFLQHVLRYIMQVISAQNIWFIYHCEPAHFAIMVHNHLNVTYLRRWIGCSRPVAWPPCFLDLSLLDFFCWGHLKNWLFIICLWMNRSLWQYGFLPLQ